MRPAPSFPGCWCRPEHVNECVIALGKAHNPLADPRDVAVDCDATPVGHAAREGSGRTRHCCASPARSRHVNNHTSARHFSENAAASMGWRSGSARGAPVHCCSALRASATCVALARLTGAEGVAGVRASWHPLPRSPRQVSACVKRSAHQQGRCSLGRPSRERAGRSLDKAVFGNVYATFQIPGAHAAQLQSRRDFVLHRQRASVVVPHLAADGTRSALLVAEQDCEGTYQEAAYCATGHSTPSARARSTQ